MELTTKALERIIGQIKQAPAGDARRRYAARQRASSHGYLRLLYADTFSDPQAVPISDLSTTGVGIVDRRIMAVGEQFGLNIVRRDGTQISLVCVVRRCHMMKDGRNKIGASFVRFDGPSNGEEKEAGAPALSNGEKRRERRVPHSKRIEIQIARSAGLSRPVSVMLQDYSPRGVGLLHAEALSPGERFILGVRGKDKQIRQMLYTVANCRKINSGKFVIGAEFTRVAVPAAA